MRDGAALRLRRPGAAPDLDGWEAGRELIFARPRIVGGQPVPKGAAVCTSAFLVRMPGGALGGLSAAHCGGLRKDRTVHRRYVGLRRPPQPGIVLGRVRQILTRSKPLDALVVPVPTFSNRSAVPGHRSRRQPPAVDRHGGEVARRGRGRLLLGAHERHRSVRPDGRPRRPPRRARR